MSAVLRAAGLTAAAAACALVIAAELRRLLVPAPGWTVPLIAVGAVIAMAWLLRAIPGVRARLAAAVATALAVPVLVVWRETGRWPLQEDVGGRDGYLGPFGYLADAAAALLAVARAWVQAVFPIGEAVEPRAATAVLAVGLALALVAAVALIAFRTPLPAILAVATALAIGTLFLGAPNAGLLAVLLAVGAVGLLLLVGDAPRGRGPLAIGAVAVAVAAAGTLALATPLAPRTAGWGWEEWTVEEPPPVGVGFVWDQALGPIRFEGEPVPVLRIDRRDAGYLRVGVLSRFDGSRWTSGLAFGSKAAGDAVALPEEAVAQAARVGDRTVREVVIRNVQLDTRALPLPAGAIGVAGLPDEVLPAQADTSGAVRLGAALPVGARYAAQVIRVPVTPELLDADVLGALTDPAVAVVAGAPSSGRYADEDPVAPWSEGADQRAQKQPGPFGKEALDAARPPRTAGLEPVPQPDALDVSFAGIIFPAFGDPDRERVVQERLDQRLAVGGFGALSLAGWRAAYRVAREVTAEATTPYQAAVLLEDWFQRTSTYDETASYTGTPLGALPQFILTEGRRGHCQYFAGSMAALLRMLGIPARVAAGFTQGRLDGDGRVITNRNAHVWVEVRFPYAGWIPFEPTPGRTVPTTTSSTSPTFAQSAAGVGGSALAGIVGRDDRPGGPAPQRGGTGGTVTPTAAPTAAATDSTLLRIVLAGLALLLVAGLVLAVVWLRKRRGERAAFAVDDPDAAARALRGVVAAWLADQGTGAVDARVADVAVSLRRQYGVDAAPWSDALVRAGYAPPAEARRAVGDARRETRAIVDRLRARSDRRERLRGAVRPRVRRWSR